MKKPRVAIVGGGVIGLSIAAELLNHEWMPIVFTHLALEDTTSANSAAFTHPVLSGPDPRIPDIFRASLVRFSELAENQDSGVRPARLRICYTSLREADLKWMEVVLATRLPDAKLPFGTEAGFDANIFQIEVEKYLPFLVTSVLRRGAKLVRKKVQLSDLASFDLVINSAGIFARSLVHDLTLRPIRGQVVLVKTPESLRKSADREYEVLMIEGPLADQTQSLDYIVFRENDTLLGGTADLDDFSLKPRDCQSRGIIDRCSEIVPELQGAKKIREKVGLRPSRPFLRLELECPRSGPCTIHCYGHGGSGVTLSWGSAELVSAMAQEWWLNANNLGIRAAA